MTSAPAAKSADDFDIGFAGDAGSHFDKLHLAVFLKDVNALLFLRLFT